VNGSSILFWKDLWLDDIASDIYPRTYSFVINEDIYVEEFLTSDSLANLFHLPLSPEAMGELRELQSSY
jgi:hypothetical protein